MKIIEYTGCVTGGLQFDDKHETDLTPEEQEKILDYILVKLKEGILDGTISLNSVIGTFQYVDYKTGNSCDQCGDTPTMTFWEI